MNARGLTSVVVVSLWALVGVFAPGAAQAAQTRNLLRTFGAAGSTVADPAPLSNPQGEAIDQSTEDVYVADTGNHRVEKFGPGGEFLLAFGFDVNKTKAAGVATQAEKDLCTDVEVELDHVECQKGESGSAPGEFTTAEFVAVDQSTHDAYVADTGDNLVSKFSSAGVLENTWGNNGTAGAANGQLNGSGTTAKTFGSIAGIAVNSTGELDVLNTVNEVFEFDSSSNLAAEVALHEAPGASASVYGLGVNAIGDFFLFLNVGPGYIEEFGPAGEFISEVVVPGTSAFSVEPVSGELYWASGESLNTLTSSVSVGFAGSGIGVASSGETFLSNAKENEVYEHGPLVTGPAAVTGTPSNSKITAHTAILEGTVNPEGQPVTGCAFEYIEASAYKPHTPDPYAGGGTAACEHPDAAEILAEVPVHAEVKGLNPNTKYDYRLTATNHEGQIPGANVEFSTQPPPSIDSATVTALTATAATLNAQIDPHNVATTYYFEYLTEASYLANREKGLELFAGAEKSSGSIPAGEADVFVSAPIALKAVNTQYYWRVVATNESGTTTTLAHTFIYTTKEGEGLPDGRAYEMVTPNRKNGALIGDVSFVGSTPDIAASGSRVIASAIQCFAGAQSCNAEQAHAIGAPYEFTRTGEARLCAPAAPPCWYTTPLAPSANTLPDSAEQRFSAQDGTALFSIPTGPALGGEGENDFYVREPTGKFVDVGPATPPEDGAQGPHGGVQDNVAQFFTADFSHFAFDAPYLWSSPFPPNGNGGHNEAYEYAPGAGNRHLDVGVSGSYENGANHKLISACATTLGTATPGRVAPGTMSADGRTVFFTAFQCPSGADGQVPVDEVFARVDGEEPLVEGVARKPETVPISQPKALNPAAVNKSCESTECIENTSLAVEEAALAKHESGPWRDANFAGASEDGSRAFFLSTQQLTDGASQDPHSSDSAIGNGCSLTVGANGCNLYEYDSAEPAGHQLLDASAGAGGAPVPGGPRVQGEVALSSDGSHVYFVAQGVLSGVERPGCIAEWVAAGRGSEAVCHAVQGADNLYVYSQATHSVSFITIMSAEDIEEWETERGFPANVTPDGRFLVFLSHGTLTADDTSRSGANQVFRYDAGSGGASSLTRLSIGNAGFNDDGNRSMPTQCYASIHVCSEDANIAPGARASRRDPSMSDDGSRVFFESPVGLTPHALDDAQIANLHEQFPGANQPLYAQNVYEWEAEGVGSCPPGRSAGCVFLISDGRDVSVNLVGEAPVCKTGSSVCLLGTDTTGDNVFITTTDQLVGSDTNTELDYYDARVCEPEHGNPCVQSPPPTPPGCKEEECHGIPAGTPGVPAAPSAMFNGSGNLTSPLSVVVKPKSLTRAQKLANALGSCRKKYKMSKKRRAACEKRAHQKYSAAKKSSKKKGK
jgi:hypothetical protein